MSLKKYSSFEELKSDISNKTPKKVKRQRHTAFKKMIKELQQNKK